MTIRIATLSLLAATAAFAAPVHLRCDYLVNPLGIDSAAPRLSWQNDAAERNYRQSAYQILVSTTREAAQAGRADVWDSGRQSSSLSIDIPYKGPALQSSTRYFWTVRVWDANNRMTQAADPAFFETALLNKSDWRAQWIAWKDQLDEDRAGIQWIAAGSAPPPTPATFRLQFNLPPNPRNVALFVASPSGFEISLNGQPWIVKRGWNSFDRQDLTGAVTAGANTIEITIPIRAPRRNTPPTPARAAALLKIVRADGSIERIPSGARWQARLADATTWQPATTAGELGPLVSPPGNLPQPASLLRRTFNLSKTVRSARLYVTALGSYQAFLNGNRVGKDVLTPEFTSYAKRVTYQTYDVTDMLAQGANAISAILGDGWFLSGHMGGTRLNFLPPPPRLLAQLQIEYTDGTRDEIVTDRSWKTAQSPIYHSEIYSGEIYDARLEQAGWNNASFNDNAWTSAITLDAPASRVVASMTDPPRVVETITPISVRPLGNGAFIADMGQNMTGWPVLRVRGPAGTRIRMRTAEILNPDGTLYRENLRAADSTDTYVLSGNGQEIYRPHFTFHGYRFIELTGYPGTPQPADILGEVLSSVPAEPTARMTTSSDLVNRFYITGIWGQRGNFLSIPTDCPQRDERQGWTGDAEVFWRTGSYNFDIAAFGRQWMRSVVDDQSTEGAYTNTVPSVGIPGDGAPGWGDAGVIVPWTAWTHYGDQAIIEENWPAMERWMEFIRSNNTNFLRRNRTGPNYADWLAPGSRTPADLIATAYWALIAGQMEDMARALGKDADAARYRELQSNIRRAFQQEYIQGDGTIASGTQTAYVLALQIKLVPDALVAGFVDKLVKDIEAHDWHLTTGFLGTPFLLFTLSDHGRTDVAYRLLLNETYPSWGYMLSKGATTWWERWNGDTGDPAMNSYNHYAFGSVMAWVYRNLTGIDTAPGGSGFKEIVIHPLLDPRMPSARGEYDSPYGKITTDWTSAANNFTLNVTIPANTTAKVYLPALPNARVTQDGQPITPTQEANNYVVETGSGSYRFQVQ